MIKKQAALVFAIPIVALLLSACVSQSAYDELQAQNQQLQGQNQQLQAQLARLQSAASFVEAGDLLFPPGGFELSPAGQAELKNNIVPKLINLQNAKVVVYGYTDNIPVGPALQQAGINDSLTLSSRRAGAVAIYLVSQGVNPAIISAKGLGDTHPVASNDAPQGRAQNRRIVIAVQGPWSPEGESGSSLAPPIERQPASNQDPRLINILYATDRSIDGSAVGDISLNEVTDKRSYQLAYGSSVIRVPDFHEIGKVERPSDYTIMGFTIWKTAENQKQYFTEKELKGLTKEQFISEVKKHKNEGVMVFVHGFDTTFADAIFKTAQIAFDTHFPGVPLTFAWPSKGNVAGYDYDRESALFSRDAFLSVLRLIYDDAGISKIYVIAHSMGNEIVVDALAHAQEAGLGISLSELVLAAPDIDSDVFRSMIDRLEKATKGLTLYASSADKAMLASRLKAGGIRAGDVPQNGPIVAEGMDTIDVTAIGHDLFGINHSEYSSNRSLIDDIGRILLTGTRPPDVRSPQLRRVPEGSMHPLYWRYAE